jgi:hypothetical protein
MFDPFSPKSGEIFPMPRNRIVEHVKVRAGDLVPHELNPRTHSDVQKQALRSLYEEIGFARSLLAYRLSDGRLKLIDGHLRQSMDAEAIVDVEVLDVTDAEARALILAIDPLAQLAGYHQENLAALREVCERDSAAVTALWETLDQAAGDTMAAVKAATKKKFGVTANDLPPEQFLVLVECMDERHQVDLLRRFKKEGLKCQAKTS